MSGTIPFRSLFDGNATRVFAELLTASHEEATKPVPSSRTDGVSLESDSGVTWKQANHNLGFMWAVVKLTADGNSTLTGPVYYYGFISADGTDGVWYRLGALNNGEDITLTATMGYAERVNFPGVFDRVAISATVSASNVDDRYVPMTSKT